MSGPITAAELAAAPPRLRKAAQDFEAQALGRLLQPVFATVDTSRGSFGGGAAEAQWRPMLVEAIATKAVRSGQGLGLANTVLRELLRRQAAQDPAQDVGAAPGGAPGPAQGPAHGPALGATPGPVPAKAPAHATGRALGRHPSPSPETKP